MIVQECVATVEYVHVELDRHDILVVEGLGAESYLDVGNRAEFENGDEPILLHPAFAPLAHEAARAPFVIAGSVLQRARAMFCIEQAGNSSVGVVSSEAHDRPDSVLIAGRGRAARRSQTVS